MHISDLHRSYAAPVRFRCLRRDLLPLTIGHLETMERMDCTEPLGAANLGTAVLICSMPWRDWPSFSTSRLLKYRMAVWRAQLGEWDIARETCAFFAYLEHEMSGPSMSPPFGAKPGKPSIIPFSRWLCVRLCNQLGHDPLKVRDYLVRDAMWDNATLAEMTGNAVVEELPYDERVVAMQASLPSDEEILKSVGVNP